MREVNSVDVTYRRKDRTAGPLAATVYEPTAEESILFGVGLDVRRRDYIIDLALLAGAGNPFGVPQKGDEISEGELVCQVQPMGLEPCFRYTNNRRNEVRVHTNIIREP